MRPIIRTAALIAAAACLAGFARSPVAAPILVALQAAGGPEASDALASAPDITPMIRRQIAIQSQACAQGDQRSCQAAQFYSQTADELGQAYQACQQGDQIACQRYVENAQPVWRALQPLDDAAQQQALQPR